MMKRYLKTLLAKAMALSIIGFIMGSSSPRPTLTSPHPSLLRSYGMDIRLLSHPQQMPISSTQAKAQVFRNFSKLSPQTPMVTELVMFANSHVPSLSKSQAAWLVTWHEHTALPTPFVSKNQPVPTYTHMNEIISATTGQMLGAFPSP